MTPQRLSQPRAKISVLVVDDHPALTSTMASLISLAFKDKVSAVHVANSKKEAVEFLKTQREKQQPIHLVFTDCNMEHDNAGLELIRHIVKNHSETKSVLMSGEPRREEAKEAGAIAFYEKPVSLEQMKEAISRAAKEQCG